MCDDAYKSDLSTTIYFAGVMSGGITFGIIADKYGRKFVVILTLLLCGGVSIATFISKTYAAFVALRYFLGFFVQVSSLQAVGDAVATRGKESETAGNFLIR